MRIERHGQIHQFLIDFTRGVALRGRPPVALTLLAFEALRGTPAARDRTAAEDVVGEFLCRELEERRAGRKSVEWTSLTPREAGAIARRRCRQVALEGMGGWNLRRQLRSHVAAALEGGPIATPAAMPESLLDGDRLSSKRIAQAVAAALTGEDAPEKTPAALTRHLKGLYFGGAVDEDVSTLAGATTDAAVEDELDGARLAELLTSTLGDDLAQVLGRRLDEETFKNIAREEAVALTTAFERCRKAESAAKAALAAEGCSRKVAAIALRRIAKAATPEARK